MHEICIITTSMGRLAHLQQSLGANAAQRGCTNVVVDFSCPERSGDWVEQHYPHVKVVRIPGQKWFSVARARNAGVRGAPETPWLCFVDADVILAPDFSQRLLPLLQAGRFYVVQPFVYELGGMLVCTRNDFLAIGGYDEVFQGWGEEDRDMLNRLRVRGLQMQDLPQEWVTPIAHEDALRVQNYAEKQIQVSETVNFLYSRAKFDLMRLLGRELVEDERRALYAQAGQALNKFRQDARENQWRMYFRQEETRQGVEILSSLTYTLGAARK